MAIIVVREAFFFCRCGTVEMMGWGEGGEKEEEEEEGKCAFVGCTRRGGGGGKR